MTTAAQLVPARSAASDDARAEYVTTTYASVADVDVAAWRVASGGSKALFVDPGFLAVVERAFAGEAEFRYVLARDASGEPKACATLCIYRIDMTTLGSAALKRWVLSIRRLVPSFGYVRIGMCGLPVSLGESSIGYAAGCDLGAVIAGLDRILNEMCSQRGAGIVLFKEHDESEAAALAGLRARGYLLAESPCMHVLDGQFESFDAYTGALRSHYRNDIRRSFRKFAAAGLEHVRLRGMDAAAAYTDELHAMYLAVVGKAENKLEILPPEFFRELPMAFGNDVSMTLVKKDGRPIAFNYSLSTGDAYYFLFCGMSYAETAEGDVYFTMLYRDLDNGLREGVDVIRLGQSSETFKARVGCRTVPLFFFVKGRGLWSLLLRGLSKYLLPPRPQAVTYKVFKE